MRTIIPLTATWFDDENGWGWFCPPTDFFVMNASIAAVSNTLQLIYMGSFPFDNFLLMESRAIIICQDGGS